MPTYVYNCEYCGDFEKFQPLNDQEPVKCPSCDGFKVAKVFVAVGVSFKGKGFYSTDNRRGGN